MTEYRAAPLTIFIFMTILSTGYDTLLFARPRLYELLLKQVPEDKILMGKRVLRTEENEDQVVIHCADNSIYQGDILIGADGAHSGVRQSLYKRLEEKNLLPNEDTKSFSIGHTLMVGVAELKDLEKYPHLKDPHSVMNHVIGGDNKAWSVCNVPDGQVCWGLVYQYRTVAESREQQFRNSEWGSESNEAMIKEFRHLPCVYGGTMGDLIDATPKDFTSKVFLEDKIFTTWFHGRTVLIGDACHKMLPWAGQGAINAMQDAVILANCLYDLTDASRSSITAAFQDYYKQRYSQAKAMVESSRLISRAIAGQHLWERALRHALLHYVPDTMQQWNLAKTAEYRPQITFLPLIKKRGTGPVLPQKPSKRYSEEQAKKNVAV
ncbi:hypothetical protein BG011_008015 [Mortierella polycephala]|uniref:FAD-binding domain-containing protein n=1 Tax=Mortierella polycephala TaxID=41804 RepID=A0A9P6U8A7_9FUNG|nr:hypothetical protein BG011_008015 [Mortierella polycephala]